MAKNTAKKTATKNPAKPEANDADNAEAVDTTELTNKIEALEKEVVELKEAGSKLETELETASNDGDELQEALDKANEEIEKLKEGDDENTPTEKLNKKQQGPIEEILDLLVSFGSPVRGALSTKPAVMESWNDLQTKAVKALKSLK